MLPDTLDIYPATCCDPLLRRANPTDLPQPSSSASFLPVNQPRSLLDLGISPAFLVIKHSPDLDCVLFLPTTPASSLRVLVFNHSHNLPRLQLYNLPQILSCVFCKGLDAPPLDPQHSFTIEELSSFSDNVPYLSSSPDHPSETTPIFVSMASLNPTSIGERMAQLSLASDNGVGDLLPSAGALLKVLSHLNAEEIQEEIVFIGMRSVALPNFPATTRAYLDARAALVNAGMVTHTISSRTLKIKTYARARAMQDMSNGKKESRLAFDAAVVLLSAGWPFLTTQNVNSVTRLRAVRKFMPHVVALRSACMNLEAAEVVPDMRFCALLQEEAWYVPSYPSSIIHHVNKC